MRFCVVRWQKPAEAPCLVKVCWRDGSGDCQTVARKLKKTFNYRLRNRDSLCKKKKEMLMYSTENNTSQRHRCESDSLFQLGLSKRMKETLVCLSPLCALPSHISCMCKAATINRYNICTWILHLIMLSNCQSYWFSLTGGTSTPFRWGLTSWAPVTLAGPQYWLMRSMLMLRLRHRIVPLKL